MSKIGRRPIKLDNVQAELQGNEVHFKGSKGAGVYVIPKELNVEIADKELKVTAPTLSADNKRLWGLHRALLANAIKGISEGFEKQLRIVGLGYKAVKVGANLQFSLGYSHKIDFDLPKEVTIEIDKSGQLLTLRSSDKVILGHTCSSIRDLRKPEPYKGTGIRYADEVILRKAGKAKS